MAQPRVLSCLGWNRLASKVGNLQKTQQEMGQKHAELENKQVGQILMRCIPHECTICFSIFVQHRHRRFYLDYYGANPQMRTQPRKG